MSRGHTNSRCISALYHSLPLTIPPHPFILSFLPLPPSLPFYNPSYVLLSFRLSVSLPRFSLNRVCSARSNEVDSGYCNDIKNTLSCLVCFLAIESLSDVCVSQVLIGHNINMATLLACLACIITSALLNTRLLPT